MEKDQFLILIKLAFYLNIIDCLQLKTCHLSILEHKKSIMDKMFR
jgi:hypothetical protein